MVNLTKEAVENVRHFHLPVLHHRKNSFVVTANCSGFNRLRKAQGEKKSGEVKE